MPIILKCKVEFKHFNEKGEKVYDVIYLEVPFCPECKEEMTEIKEKCLRVEKLMGGIKIWLLIERRLCTNENCSCRSKRLLPNTVVPFKHYGSDIIGDHIREGITGEPADCVTEQIPEGGSEDLPALETISRWFHWMMANMEVVEDVIAEQHRVFPDGEDGRFKSGTLNGFLGYPGDKERKRHWLGVLLVYLSRSGRVMKPA